jgi:signal transduction histidine kinase/HAMP domain-containing protein
MFLRSVKTWLTLLFLVVVVLDVGLAYALVVPTLETRLVNQRLQDLRDTSTRDVGVPLTSALLSSPYVNKETVATTANLIDTNLNARVIVIDATNGVKLADSRNAPLAPKDYGVLAEAIATGRAQVGRQTVNGVDYAVAALPLTVDPFTQKVGYVALVSSSLADVRNAVAEVEQMILLAAALALGITILTGYLTSFFIARRLKRIELRALSIAEGDFSSPIGTGPLDEIGQLAATVNTMGQRLRDAFGQLARERDNIEALLDDLTEGVIGASPTGTVTIANPTAERLIDRRLPAGVDLASTLPDDVARAYQETRDDGEDRTVVFLLASRVLEASVYGVGSEAESESIIVLRDVTEQARLDQARRDFIATASHELKTPLFSLSGFMELIDEEELDPETQREFLAIMRQQVDRLTTLSLSLLDLSQVDAGAVRLQVDDVDITPIVSSVAVEFELRAGARGVTITVDSPPGTMAFCDESRLAQVLRALIDNAVKFSPDDGSVRIEVKAGRKTVQIAIEDQGPGIPREELALVFERFYRGTSDESKPGTGLGLSIAKDMAELMGGTLSVTSSPGAGSRFTVRVPRRGA